MENLLNLSLIQFLLFIVSPLVVSIGIGVGLAKWRNFILKQRQEEKEFLEHQAKQEAELDQYITNNFKPVWYKVETIPDSRIKVTAFLQRNRFLLSEKDISDYVYATVADINTLDTVISECKTRAFRDARYKCSQALREEIDAQKSQLLAKAVDRYNKNY